MLFSDNVHLYQEWYINAETNAYRSRLDTSQHNSCENADTRRALFCSMKLISYYRYVIAISWGGIVDPTRAMLISPILCSFLTKTIGPNKF